MLQKRKLTLVLIILKNFKSIYFETSRLLMWQQFLLNMMTIIFKKWLIFKKREGWKRDKKPKIIHTKLPFLIPSHISFPMHLFSSLFSYLRTGESLILKNGEEHFSWDSKLQSVLLRIRPDRAKPRTDISEPHSVIAQFHVERMLVKVETDRAKKKVWGLKHTIKSSFPDIKSSYSLLP